MDTSKAERRGSIAREPCSPCTQRVLKECRETLELLETVVELG
jgi:hypothetical protein